MGVPVDEYKMVRRLGNHPIVSVLLWESTPASDRDKWTIGLDQETVGITEGEMLLPSGEYLFSRKQTVTSMILSGYYKVNSNWSLFMNSVLSLALLE